MKKEKLKEKQLTEEELIEQQKRKQIIAKDIAEWNKKNRGSIYKSKMEIPKWLKG